MLVKELINHLEKMDENSTVKLQIKTKFDEESPTYASVETIEFGNDLVLLKGDDELVEWE